MSFIATLGAVALSRVVGSFINKVGDYIFPYESSKGAKQVEHTAALNRITQREMAEISGRLQKELAERNIKSNQEIHYFTTMAQRQTAMLVATKNASYSLRNSLIQDAIRNFPLNISPLILLENNNIDINVLLNGHENQEESIIERLIATKPLSVFISPIHIDSRVGGKEMVAAQVWDSVYSNVESLFINEYSRNGIRPVIFYPTAWNKNVRSGLHAAEELYYFLKDLPSLVIEPRFDGKKLKIMFSCWGLGYSAGTHFRQELVIDIDWAQLIVNQAYERSKKTIDLFSSIKDPDKSIKDRINACTHNVKMYNELKIEERLDSGEILVLDSICDYSKLFYVESSDLQVISEIISSSLGLTVAAISDTHHLLSSDVEPRLPMIFKEYFGSCVNNELLKQFVDMYKQTYLKLEFEFPQREDKYKKQLESISVTTMLLGDNAVNSYEESVFKILADRCIDRWGNRNMIRSIYETNKFDKIFEYYLEHFDSTDFDFNEKLMIHLNDSQKKMIQQKTFQITNEN